MLGVAFQPLTDDSHSFFNLQQKAHFIRLEPLASYIVANICEDRAVASRTEKVLLTYRDEVAWHIILANCCQRPRSNDA